MRWARARGAIVSNAWSPRWTVPVSARRRPARQASRVDFPAPLGPMIAVTWPGTKAALTPCRTCLAPKRTRKSLVANPGERDAVAQVIDSSALSGLLFFVGVVFCFYLVFPFVLKFLLGFNEILGIQPQIRLSEWISFAVTLPLLFGISFQLPLVMLFMERLSILEVSDYREKRRMSILVIAILSMFLTPADPISMLMMMFPLCALYELGILLCEFSPAKSPFDGELALR